MSLRTFKRIRTIIYLITCLLFLSFGCALTPDNEALRKGYNSYGRYEKKCLEKAEVTYNELKHKCCYKLAVGKRTPISEILHVWIEKTDENDVVWILDPSRYFKPKKKSSFPKDWYIIDEKETRRWGTK